MICPNCGNNIAHDSNFCEKCGTPLKAQRSRRTQNGAVLPPRGRPWDKVWWKDLYRDNKPGFFIIAAMLLAMFVSMGYYTYSIVRPGRFVVTIEKISREEYLDIFTKATLNVYCREFARECSSRERDQLVKEIHATLLRILLPVRTLDAKITYKNNTRYPIAINRFLYRTAPGPWEVSNMQNHYRPKIERLRLAIAMANENVPFETKVDYANTLALVELDLPVQPREQREWRIGYNDKSEFQVEFLQNGKLHQSSVLRPR